MGWKGAAQRRHTEGGGGIHARGLPHRRAPRPSRHQRAVPDARYVEHEGGDHVPWFRDADVFIAELREFLPGEREPAVPDRVLATVLFTDIVDSTARAATAGDRKWRQTRSAPASTLGRSRASATTWKGSRST